MKENAKTITQNNRLKIDKDQIVNLLSKTYEHEVPI